MDGIESADEGHDVIPLASEDFGECMEILVGLSLMEAPFPFGIIFPKY